MPVTPSTVFDPRDTVTFVLNTSRHRLNDKIATLQACSGKVLDEYDAFTQQVFNSAYRRLGNELQDASIEKFTGEVVISNIPVVANLDPASQCFISFTQFFNGTNYMTAPVLPADLLIPLWMAERQTGVNLPFPPINRPNMTPYADGLPSNGKFIWNRSWEWRDEAIYFPGALQAVDFRIRYRKTLPNIADGPGLRWFEQTVPILRCSDALAWWVCYEFATARMADGDGSNVMANVAKTFKAEAQTATTLMVNQTVMKNQRMNVRQMPYGGYRGGANW